MVIGVVSTNFITTGRKNKTNARKSGRENLATSKGVGNNFKWFKVIVIRWRPS